MASDVIFAVCDDAIYITLIITLGVGSPEKTHNRSHHSLYHKRPTE
jgi:hypothetical protein